MHIKNGPLRNGSSSNQPRHKTSKIVLLLFNHCRMFCDRIFCAFTALGRFVLYGVFVIFLLTQSRKSNQPKRRDSQERIKKSGKNLHSALVGNIIMDRENGYQSMESVFYFDFCFKTQSTAVYFFKDFMKAVYCMFFKILRYRELNFCMNNTKIYDIMRHLHSIHFQYLGSYYALGRFVSWAIFALSCYVRGLFEN